MSSDAEWLDRLQVGDPVIIAGRLAHVARLTKTQVIVKSRAGSDVRYRRKDGDRVGPNYSYSDSLMEPTIERRAELRKQQLVSFVRHHVAWGQLPLVTLEAVAELVSKAGKAKRCP